ncbi:MAG: NapC/NirT family cytochrome c [Bacteroidota bacterium]|nr:NapC/NirT family cytochrome c [Bacteroidota bacterium]
MNLPKSTKNLVTIAGTTIAIISFLIILILFFISTLFDSNNSFLGIFIYMVLPALMVFGLLLIPIGMIRAKRQEKRKVAGAPQYPLFDFNKPSTRNAAIIFLVGTVFLVILSSIGSFQAFHITESNEFCGKLCHKVMKPEYTAYQNSPHSRVKCVECHVGSGAGWYVRSKITGLYQVYAVITGQVPRPILTPIESLRPAMETCEHCHWPEKFYDRKQRNIISYLADEATTAWNVHLQMKTSASNSAQGNAQGIHWHINKDVKIEYISSVRNREKIPWVKYTNLKTGEVTIFEDIDEKLTAAQHDTLAIRKMDCIDCHNRPSHNYQAPQNFIDELITAGKIPHELPDVKLVAMDVLNQDYSTNDSAMMAIKTQVDEYYSAMYPELLETSKKEIEKAIAGMQEGYSQNFFPEMKVKWTAYPNHIGHMETNGCFRCHNDRHTSASGKVISRDCNLCHSIVAQGTNDEIQISNSFNPLEFKHPVEINEEWRTKLCADCHCKLY